jgi:hypothetical protein
MVNAKEGLFLMLMFIISPLPLPTERKSAFWVLPIAFRPCGHKTGLDLKSEGFCSFPFAFRVRFLRSPFVACPFVS